VKSDIVFIYFLSAFIDASVHAGLLFSIFIIYDLYHPVNTQTDSFNQLYC